MVGKQITPKQLAQQWLRLPNKFEVNIFNFETLIGNAAKQVFKDSFYLRRFNSAGTFAWQPRKESYYWSHKFLQASVKKKRKPKTHPLLEETGTLKHSIVWDRVSSGKQRGVHIFTDPDMFKFSKRQYGRNFCYAAIHNEGGAKVGATQGAAFIPQRQFIGYSTVIADRLSSLSIRIFDGFPK